MRAANEKEGATLQGLKLLGVPDCSVHIKGSKLVKTRQGLK